MQFTHLEDPGGDHTHHHGLMMHRRQWPVWVDNKQKGEIVERLGPVKRVVNRQGTCLFVVDEGGGGCGNPVDNNCHAIPEAGVLSELKDRLSGKVLELQWNVDRWGHHFLSSNEANPVNRTLDSFEPQLVGTGDACVRWFACRDHDVDFHPIDVRYPDFSNPVVPFLCLYRSTLYAADLLRMVSGAMAMWGRRALNSHYIQTRVEWIKSKNEISKTIPHNHRILSRLGKAWHIKKAYGHFEPDIVCGQLLSFHSRVKFAACVSYKREITAIVFPCEGDLHKVGVLHLTEDSNSVKRNKERLVHAVNVSNYNDDYGVDVLKELLVNGFGAAAISPESYRGLPDGEKRTIRELVATTSGYPTMARAFRL